MTAVSERSADGGGDGGSGKGTNGGRKRTNGGRKRTTGARMTRQERGPKGLLIAARMRLTAWLGRPLADFHILLAIFGLLTVLGLGMVLSASSVEAYTSDSSVYSLFKKQLAFAGIGLLVFWVAARLPLRKIRYLSGWAVLFCLGMLVAVLVIGHESGGSRGWFRFGPVSFQPVEAAKVALALWGAHVLVQKKSLLRQYRHLLVPLIPVALVMFALVMLQPDLGSTVSLGIVVVALLWFVGAPMRLFGTVALGAGAGLLVLAIGAQYRLTRVLSFLRPGDDPSGAAYQANQALYALADGGLFGRGLGQGPSKWRYLPNLHTDFIYALIGEELGFVGAALVLGLFVMLAVVGLRIAARNADPWIRLVAATLTVSLVAQAAINIGYVVGLLPVTGVTLPLISYGGTSIVITMLMFGILANCARHEPEAVSALRSQGPGTFGMLLRLPAPDPYEAPVRRKPPRPSPPPKPGARPSGPGQTGSGGRASAPYGQDRRPVSRPGAATGTPRGSSAGGDYRQRSNRPARGMDSRIGRPSSYRRRGDGR
jgi:cell division protein FtsW